MRLSVVHLLLVVVPMALGSRSLPTHGEWGTVLDTIAESAPAHVFARLWR